MKLRNQPEMIRPISSRYILICCLAVFLVLSVQAPVLAGELLIDKVGKDRKAERGIDSTKQQYAQHFMFYKEQADDYYERSKLDSALIFYGRALFFGTADQQLKNRIKRIERVLAEQKESKERPMADIDAQKILIDSYLEQADSFIKKNYYVPALELVTLVQRLDNANKISFALEKRIQSERENDIKKYIQAAIAAEQKFDYAAALDSYYKVLELDPFNKLAMDYRKNLFKQLSLTKKIRLGISSYQRENKSRARQFFEDVLVLEPDNEVAIDYLERIGKPKSITKTQSKSITKTGPATLETLQADQKIWPLYLEGLKLMRDKKYQEAIKVWEKVLKAYPNSPNTINNINQARLRLKAEQKN